MIYAVLCGGFVGLAVLFLVIGGMIMSQQDDILAELADIKASQAEAATAGADLADDIDKLLALVQQGADLTAIETAVKDVQATARAQADALKATAAKFPTA